MVMQPGPAVGVVVPVFDTAPAFLDECMRSVLAQSVEVGVVLVDDASTDHGTVESLARWRAEGVTVITLTENQGVASALNSGVRHLTTPYLLPVGSDDVVHPEYARAAQAVLDVSPGVSIVASPLELFGGDQGVWQPRTVSSARDLLYSNCLPGVSVFRRADWESVGGFRDGLRWGEDWDLWLRIVHAHGQAVVLDQPLYRWRSHAAQLSTRTNRAAQFERHLEHVQRNRGIYAEYLDAIMEDHWTAASTLASFKRRYGRINDLVNQVRHLTAGLSRPSWRRSSTTDRSNEASPCGEPARSNFTPG